MYQENILDHYESPRNFGHLAEFDVKAHDSNPLCGDVFDMEFRFNNGTIAYVKFTGHGCAISTASASMLTEKIKMLDVEKALKLEKDDVLELLGIEISHVRIKCALLPLKIIKLGIYEYISKKK